MRVAHDRREQRRLNSKISSEMSPITLTFSAGIVGDDIAATVGKQRNDGAMKIPVASFRVLGDNGRING